jgi:hypothetical protein
VTTLVTLLPGLIFIGSLGKPLDNRKIFALNLFGLLGLLTTWIFFIYTKSN